MDLVHLVVAVEVRRLVEVLFGLVLATGSMWDWSPMYLGLFVILKARGSSEGVGRWRWVRCTRWGGCLRDCRVLWSLS
jgi:hypothetical protein